MPDIVHFKFTSIYLKREEIFNLIFQGLSINFLRRAENQITNYLGLDVFRLETIFKEK